MNPLRKTVFALAVLALLSGCEKRADANLRKIVTGSWAQGSNGVLILAPNRTCSARWTNWHATPPAAWAYQGRWSVRDGGLTMASTNVQSWNTTGLVPGTVETYKIVKADDLNL